MLSTMQRTIADPTVGGGDVVLGAPAVDRGPACRPGGRKRASCTSTTGTGPSYAAAAREQSRRGRLSPQVRSVSLSSQVPITLREEPDRAVDAALVGEVGRPRLLGQHRLVELEAGEGPGAERDVRRVVGLHRARRPPRTRCRASRPRPRARRPPTRSATWGSRSPTTSPGSTRAGKSVGVEAEPHHQLGVPLARRDVEQPGRRGVGALGDVVAGERRSRRGRGSAGSRSASPSRVVGGQLVERVEGQVLQAVAPVELLGADQRGDGGRTLRRRGARRGSGTAGRASRPCAQPPVVDGPGVDADRGERPLGVRRGEAGDRVVDQRLDVPVQAVVGARPGRWGTGPRPSAAACRARPRRPSPGRWRRPGRRRRRAQTRLIAGTLPRRRSRRGCAGRWCGSARGSRARTPPGRSARAAPRA